MNPIYKRIELIANIAIIVVALLIGVFTVKRYLLPTSQPIQPEVESGVKTGVKLTLPAVDWEKNRQTLLLVLSKGCRFCTESAAFYQQLARQRGDRQNVRLVAVLPQEISEGQKYLSELGVTVDEIRQALPSALGARGTPTLILVNSAGLVTDSWVGKLPSDKESEVLNRLQ
jgi:thioredoxin-related protein